MPQVTTVEPQKRTKGRFNIYIDGKYAFGINEDLLVKYRILKGKIFSVIELNKIVEESSSYKLIDKIYNLLLIRQRSEREIRDYIRKKSILEKNFGRDEISQYVEDSIVEMLKKKGLINDFEFGKLWVESRRRSKYKGKIALRAELLIKGIDKKVIDQILSVEETFNNEEELAEKALVKKNNLWKSLSNDELRVKSINYLLRKGFEYDVIKNVVAKILNNR